MASIYTHNKFGLDLIDKLNPTLKDISTKYNSYYLLGQQGPDFLFFNPKLFIKKNAPGNYIHAQSFKSFLDLNKVYLKSQNLSSPLMAYLLGATCHFILDSKIHPTVNSLAEKQFSHQDIESELDRYFLLIDENDPITFHLENLIPRDKTIFKNVYPLYKKYKNINYNDFLKSMEDFYKWKKFFHTETLRKEKIILNTMSLFKVKNIIGGQIIRQTPFDQAYNSNKILSETFTSALNAAPKLLENALDYIYNDAPLYSEFFMNYNGIK
ncbi:Zinc dependent phospholipase C [Anaerosphaera aminiphila DSM 21120]|uniref:Zinc dependent phospholipase C n=1 Tax=Anaerosphaera aminiphila DSM 21120 TaxID=1120995 RepID=A0A1M5UMU7_9FIRM|nr:zinc dependent phospholipase C family protein [Anaerosphaera aminiphila]SHH64271.1 Zinc dependent phospholipase C [Anaerosphaera aminiphila DSM 21120]